MSLSTNRVSKIIFLVLIFIISSIFGIGIGFGLSWDTGKSDLGLVIIAGLPIASTDLVRRVFFVREKTAPPAGIFSKLMLGFDILIVIVVAYSLLFLL